MKISVGESKIFRYVPILGIDIKIELYKTGISRTFNKQDSLQDSN